MTIRLASDGPQTLHADTIGAAWLAVAGRILAEGIASRYDGLPVREISLVTLAIDRPDPADEIIASHAEPDRLAWMHANFTDHAQVTALGDADSYATRLFDYEHSGRDQVAWVVDRLRRDPATRSAAITTFQPHTDASYIPCVSLLDFWLPDGAVELDVGGFSLMGGNTEVGSERPPRPGAPVIKLRTWNLMGGATIFRVPPQARGLDLKQARRLAKAAGRGQLPAPG